jgi:hypothetical protein
LDLGDDAGEVGTGEQEAVQRGVGRGFRLHGRRGLAAAAFRRVRCIGRRGLATIAVAADGFRRAARLVVGEDLKRAPQRRRLGSKALLHCWCARKRGMQRSGRD